MSEVIFTLLFALTMIGTVLGLATVTVLLEDRKESGKGFWFKRSRNSQS